MSPRRMDDDAHETAADASVPKTKRGPGRPKGIPASEKQKEASRINRQKAMEARAKSKATRQALKAEPGYKPRWKQLEDGDISVADLTLKELMKGACANNDGTWEGRRHELPPRLKNAMNAEWKRRFRARFDRLAPKALKAFEDLVQDEDNPAQRWAATKFMLEHQIGKAPDVIHVGVETGFDRLQQNAFIVQRGTDLQQELERMATGAIDNTGHDVVTGEVEEGQ